MKHSRAFAEHTVAPAVAFGKRQHLGQADTASRAAVVGCYIGWLGLQVSPDLDFC